MSQPVVKLSKRQKPFAKLVERNKPYLALDAMKLMKQAATAKFDESVDVAVNLGIDAKKSDQTVRGSVVLPAGTGKTVRVAVPRATRPPRPKPPGPTSSAWRTWPSRSRPARWIST